MPFINIYIILSLICVCMRTFVCCYMRIKTLNINKVIALQKAKNLCIEVQYTRDK